MNARSGRTYLALLNGAPTGRVGTLTLGLEWPNNDVAVAPSAAGIVETSPGAYTGTRTAPVVTEATDFVIVWFDSGLDVSVTETLTVQPGAQVDLGLYYASPDDVRAYLGVTSDQLSDDVLTRPLVMSQRDIDAAVGGWTAYDDTGLKFASTELTLTDAQDQQLRMATCAQVEYRMTMGDEFMVRDQYDSQGGSAFSTVGQLRKVSGASYTHLRQGGFMKLYGHAERRHWRHDLRLRNPLRFGDTAGLPNA